MCKLWSKLLCIPRDTHRYDHRLKMNAIEYHLKFERNPCIDGIFGQWRFQALWEVHCISAWNAYWKLESRVQSPHATKSFTRGACREYSKKKVAAFRGMHVSPAKHSFGKCDRQTDRQRDGRTDGQTDRQTDDRQSDPFVSLSLCFAGDTKTLDLKCHRVPKME